MIGGYRGKKRKAQFFIITVLLVAGSLSMTMSVLEDYDNIEWEQVSSSRAPVQFSGLERSLKDVWHNENWDYRREIEISNNRMLTVDKFPMKMDIDLDTIDDEKIEQDCSDLRFTNDEDRNEIPFQIEDDNIDCHDSEITVWLLVDFDGDGFTEDIYMHYGNSEVDFPEFESDLEITEEGRRIQNSYYNIRWNESNGECGFINLQDRFDNEFFFGESIYRTDGANCGDVDEIDEGPVFTEWEVDGTKFKFFSQNSIIRREDGFTADTTYNGNDMMWYGDYTDQPGMYLDSFHPGEEDDIETADMGNTLYSEFTDVGDPVLLGVVEDSLYSGLYITTHKTSDDIDDVYGLKGLGETGEEENQGYFGFYEGGSTPSLDYIDYVVSGRGFPVDKLLALNDPFDSYSFGEEEKGMFFPSSGWDKMVDVEIKNEGDRFVNDEYVNISMDLSVFEDERIDNLVVRDGEQLRNRKIWPVAGEYDTTGYDEPEDFDIRVPFEEGFGEFVNASETGDYYLRLEGPQEPLWDVGINDLSMNLSERILKEGEDSSNFWPYIDTSFSFSMWIKDDFGQYGSGDEVVLFEGAERNIMFRINTTGNPRAEGYFENDEGEFAVQTPNTLESGEWNHVAYIYDIMENDIKVFLNGEDSDWVDVESELPAPATSPENLDDGFEFGRGFHGKMDEFKYYTRRLSDQEIIHQQNRESTISFETSVEPRSRNSDIQILAAGNTGFDEFSVGAAAIDYGNQDDLRVQVSDVREFEDSIERFTSVLEGTEIARNLDMEVKGKCVDLDLEVDVFNLQKFLC